MTYSGTFFGAGPVRAGDAGGIRVTLRQDAANASAAATTISVIHRLNLNRETGEIPWLPLAAVALAALVVGFAAGWLLRGDGGEATVLPAAEAAPLADETAAPPEPEPAPAPATARPRSEVAVAVLNGVGIAGLAGEAAEGLRSSGYRIVQVDDGPAQDGPTQVYFVAGLKPEAERLRRELGISPAVTALPDGPVRDTVPEAAQLVVLLGAG